MTIKSNIPPSFLLNPPSLHHNHQTVQNVLLWLPWHCSYFLYPIHYFHYVNHFYLIPIFSQWHPPYIKSSTRPISPIDPMSPLVKQENLPPISIATTQSDDLSHSSIRIHIVDVPIYAHHLVNDFPDEQTNLYLSSQLLNSHLATILDGHMDMGSPLYALYKAFLQCHHLVTLIFTNTADAHHTLCKQILCSIHEELKGDLFLAMYQLGMPAFADDVKWYCRELSNASPTLTSNIPTASLSPLSDKELQAIEHSEAHWTGNFRWTPLSPNHPCFDKACFHCHCLGHIRINCQFYTCPTCLHNAPDYVQNCCPLHCHYNPTHTLSSLSSSSNHSTSSMGSLHPVPPPLADRLSSLPSWQTFCGSYCTHTTTAHIHTPSIQFCGVCPPTLGTDDDDVYDTNTWRNINGN